MIGEELREAQKERISTDIRIIKELAQTIVYECEKYEKTNWADCMYVQGTINYIQEKIEQIESRRKDISFWLRYGGE